MHNRRRLTTIVSADVVGYSRLMGRDESGTHARVTAHRHELIDPAIDQFQGRIVKTTGDGLLLEFGSVVDAVQWAAAIQRGMRERNRDVRPDERIDYRIGVNMGDVIAEQGDLFGDAVNVAARVEALAEPGGICVSAKVYEEVKGKVRLEFEDHGVLAMKNIVQPIRVYALRPDVPITREGSPPAAAAAPLYGRAEDVEAVRALVQQHGLVTIVGSGGIGKTRLAEAVAREVQGSFADGARIVELAPLADADLVATTVARALGVATGDPQHALATLARATSGRRQLLVLDNCEHLLDAVDELVGVLRSSAPGLHILATSQELLRHADEHVYRLGPLALPTEVTLTAATRTGAVQLFVARVQALQPRFVLDSSNVNAVTEICRRLDGIPLALELAAARVPMLGVEGVMQRLHERFHLLTAGSRRALRRHQTLRAALEWSYSLLNDTEKAVFESLGVFSGSFSLESAQNLLRDEAIDEWTALDTIGALVDKSLIVVDDHVAARYRMLETTRAFALERLVERGVMQDMLRRHAEVMVDAFERYHREVFRGASVAKLIADLAPDLDNLRGALRWAIEPGGDRGIGIALIGTVGTGSGYLHLLGVKPEGWQWCRRFEPYVDATIPKSIAARFWLACAEQGVAASLQESTRSAERAVRIYSEIDDRVGAFLAWNLVMYSLMLAGREPEALMPYEQARRLRDPAWPPRLQSIYHNVAGLLFQALDEDKAREHLSAFLELSRDVSEGEYWTALSLLIDLDVQAAGDVDDAADRAAALFSLYRQRGGALGFDAGLGLRSMATALMIAGRLDDSAPVYAEAIQVLRRTYGHAAFALEELGLLIAQRGRIDDAARLSAYARRVYESMGREPRLVGRRCGKRLAALLAEARSPEALARLSTEGRMLTDDQACAIALDS
ncbi:MAG TPA: adenylate/guanylate cyclase domain-containing protein [Casimicrobiaceae bacterium]|nr:adenylate/guanylate cyclase domain-containing protein [Casimicrobiaceae bacterium]